MIRSLVFLMVLVGCVGIPGGALAQAPETVVVTDPGVERLEIQAGGALKHTADATPTGVIVVSAGLSVLGFTLAGIVHQRRSVRSRVVPNGSVAYGSRSGRDSWGPLLGRRTARVSSEESRPRPRVTARSRS